MTDWKTIRIPDEDFERHNEKRQQMRLTWAEYIDSMAPELWMATDGDHELVIDPSDRESQPINYDRIREIVREETRAALHEVAR